jgi:hypothetical protein
MGQRVSERNGSAKLTASEVGRIRLRLVAGDRQSVICRDYGMSPTQISRIEKGTAWAQ